jgi:hypothetical protein
MFRTFETLQKSFSLTDNSGTLFNDIKAYLEAAKARNILVIFVLWNGASMGNQVKDKLDKCSNNNMEKNQLRKAFETCSLRVIRSSHF